MNDEIVEILKREHAFKDFIGSHPKLKSLLKELQKVADCNLIVLLWGETGTGKGCCAEIIHQISNRNNAPFIPYNCGAGPDSLFESQIFGHIKGSFTGAHKDRIGLVEDANNGILFLDEINSLSIDSQVKLNYFLETGKFRRLGENRIRKSNVRIIAASTVNLKQEVFNKNFREDLYYRLSEYEINIPPLRERKSDIPQIAKHFFKKYEDLNKKNPITLTPEMLNGMSDYNWPGNVRELKNVIKRTMIGNSPAINNYDNQQDKIYQIELTNDLPDVEHFPWKKAKNQVIAMFEKNYLKSLLNKYNGVVSRCARHAEIHAPDFWKLMRKYNLLARDFRN
ncbi:sigma-54-dependent Fis family transcriptional regulator [candidate division KSB1 bacterium]|nr:sigma-54-dependent Fis family transcriptional regulator [candidate division KSB1 bacterium]